MVQIHLPDHSFASQIKAVRCVLYCEFNFICTDNTDTRQLSSQDPFVRRVRSVMDWSARLFMVGCHLHSWFTTGWTLGSSSSGNRCDVQITPTFGRQGILHRRIPERPLSNLSPAARKSRSP